MNSNLKYAVISVMAIIGVLATFGVIVVTN